MSSSKTPTSEPRARTGDTRSLDDTEITTARTDRRSFLARTMIAGSLALGAAATAACPGGGSSDGTDSDSESQ